MGVRLSGGDDLRVGDNWAALPLLGYLATGCEHRNNYRDFFMTDAFIQRPNARMGGAAEVVARLPRLA
jgi:hypothetical protein